MARYDLKQKSAGTSTPTPQVDPDPRSGFYVKPGSNGKASGPAPISSPSEPLQDDGDGDTD